MKNSQYSFSNTDIKTLLCTLSVIPLVQLDNISDIQQSINNSCCASAAEKLSSYRTDFHPNEVRVMASSLELSDLILRGEIEASEEIRKTLSQFMFSINRLLPVFAFVFD